MKKAILITLLVLMLGSCNPFIEDGVRKNDLNRDVELVTDFGTVVFRLSDETPLHRNNFIRLVKQEFFDDLLFHRVINDFLLQTGDPDSRASAPGEEVAITDLPNTIPPEFTPKLFHKRGAINAARSDNPERASSSTQFTIIQGRLYNDSTLAVAEGRINGWLQDNLLANSPPYQELLTLYRKLEQEMPGSDSLANVQASKEALAALIRQDTPRYTIPADHREAYKTIGGAAHLDQNYTVFGEVISGMDVVDRIAAVPTDERERPLEDVRIITARLVRRR